MIYRAGVAAEATQACLPEMWDWLENGRAKDSPERVLELSHGKDKFFSPFLRASSTSSTDLLLTTGARGRVVFVIAFHHSHLGEGTSLGWLWETGEFRRKHHALDSTERKGDLQGLSNDQVNVTGQGDWPHTSPRG